MTRTEALEAIKACQMVGTYDFADDEVMIVAILLALRVMGFQLGKKAK